MTTIEIIQERPETEQPIYRAICGEQQATGATPGQALDSLERELTVQQPNKSGGATVILQRFGPDAFFAADQQHRLQELMEHFHTASAAGQELSSDEKRELEGLVDMEQQAAIDRATAILHQRDAPKSSS